MVGSKTGMLSLASVTSMTAVAVVDSPLPSWSVARTISV